MALAALAVVLGLVAGGASASGDPPVNTVLPVVSGVAQVGQTLSASTGSWSGTARIAYGYQWRRCGASYSGAVLGDGAQSYWRLGEASGAVAASETGSGGGSYQGGVTLGQPGALSGDGNTSVALDGATGAVSLPNPNLAGPFTIELWAFLKGSGSTGATGHATLAGYDWTHRLLWSTGNGLLLAQFDGNFFSTASASLNAWHQIVYSFDGSAEHFYIDGVPAGSHPTTLPRWQSPFYLGAYDLDNYLFNGRLDDTAVYNKALTPAQVAAHYGAGQLGWLRDDRRGDQLDLQPGRRRRRGATLQVTVAAQNSAGNASAQSVPTGTVAAATGTPPSNTALPTISGIAQVGQTLTATTGAWSRYCSDHLQLSVAPLRRRQLRRHRRRDQSDLRRCQCRPRRHAAGGRDCPKHARQRCRDQQRHRDDPAHGQRRPRQYGFAGGLGGGAGGADVVCVDGELVGDGADCVWLSVASLWGELFGGGAWGWGAVVLAAW